jgi:protocatechuate 3,4-dioxygenase beta subunit
MTRSSASALLVVPLAGVIVSLALLAAPASCVTIQPGWPQVTQDQVRSSPAVGDLDGDGDLEVVVGSDDGHVYAWHHDGTPVAGWPQTVAGYVASPPVLADLDRDGDVEVVVGCGALIEALGGKVYAWHGNGQPVTGWPKDTESTVMSSPAIGDLFGDGDLEVVVGSSHGIVYAWYGDGTPVQGWPEGGTQVNWETHQPALGDLDNDGDLEVVVGFPNHNVYAWHSSGRYVAGWPRSTNGAIYGSPALGDLDFDGGLEVAVSTDWGEVGIWHGDGSDLLGWPLYLDAVSRNGSPAFGDIDDDGRLEVIVPSDDYKVYAWHADGTPVAGWPQSTGGWVQTSPALGDLDGDGDLEIVVGCKDHLVYAWHHDGTAVAGWPQSTGFYVESSPALADLDRDGDVEVIVGSADHNVYVWSCDTPTMDVLPWPMFHHDAVHSGVYGGPQQIPVTRGRLGGHVRAAGATTPISGATVAAYLGGELKASTVTDYQGAYEIHGLVPGVYTVTAAAPYRMKGTVTGLTVAAGQSTSADFSLEAAGRITGQVKEAGTSASLANATVTAYLASQPVAAATTDSNGMYVIETSTASSEYAVAAAKVGYQTQTKGHIAVTLGETTYVNFSLEALPRLTGHVRGAATGLPLIGASVEVYSGVSLVASAVTSAPDGLYRFGSSLPPGEYSVTARRQGFLDQTQAGVAVSIGQTAEVDFALELSQGQIAGQVLESGTGTPVGGASVEARLGGLLKGSATTADNGMYAIPALEVGEYDVTASKRYYVSQTQTSVAVALGQTTQVDFALAPCGLITGVIQDRDTGQYLAATVSAYLHGELIATTASPTSVYSLQIPTASGDYIVVATAPGYEKQEKWKINVVLGQTTYVNFRLQSAVLEGQVTDRLTGQPIIGARVDVYPEVYLHGHELTAAPYGVYRYSGAYRQYFQPGSYIVVASMDGYVSQTKRNIVVVADQISYCNFALDPITVLKGQVSDQIMGQPLDGATVEILKDGAVWQSGLSQPPWGIYEMQLYLYQGIPSGGCVVRASKPGYVRQEKWGITIAAGGTTYVNFVLQPSGRLKGQVTDADTGLPLVGAVVKAYRNGVRCAEAMTTQPYGMYGMDSDLPAGTFVVTAGKPGYLVFGRSGIVVTAGATTYVNFALSPAH